MKIARSLLTSLLTSALVATPMVAMPAVAQAQSNQPMPIECRGVLTEVASRGQVFYRGAEGPWEIADAVRDNLRQDPSGKTRLRPVKSGDQAYTTSLQLFCALKEADPRARNLSSLAELEGYLRGLVAAEPPEGRVWSACITPKGVRMRCQLRAYNPKEQVWINPQTAVSVFMQGCTNPISGREVPGKCYVVHFDYREQRDVRWIRGTGGDYALVSLHLSFTEEQVRRMYADDCFFVEDGHSKRKPELDCAEALCPPGSQWPTVELARKVGLPEGKPPSSVFFGLQHGKGLVSFPLSAVRDLTTFNPCVYVQLYPVSVPEYRGYRAVARFDVVRKDEFQRSLPGDKLPRVMVGGTSY